MQYLNITKFRNWSSVFVNVQIHCKEFVIYSVNLMGRLQCVNEVFGRGGHSTEWLKLQPITSDFPKALCVSHNLQIITALQLCHYHIMSVSSSALPFKWESTQTFTPTHKIPVLIFLSSPSPPQLNRSCKTPSGVNFYSD